MWQIPIFTGGIPQLLSAMSSLTSVFGMGTGVTSITSSPRFLVYSFLISLSIKIYIFFHIESLCLKVTIFA